MARIKYASQNPVYSGKAAISLLSGMTFSNAAGERYSIAAIAIWGIDWKRMKKRGAGQFLRKPVLSRIGFRISGKIKTAAAAAALVATVGETVAIGNVRDSLHIYKSSLSKLNVIAQCGQPDIIELRRYCDGIFLSVSMIKIDPGREWPQVDRYRYKYQAQMQSSVLQTRRLKRFLLRIYR